MRSSRSCQSSIGSNKKHHWCRIRLLAAALLTFAPLTAPAAEPWPTTRFEVFVGSPFVDSTVGGGIAGNLLGPENLDEADEEDLPHPSAVAELEKALHEAAVWFKSKELPPPALEPLMETDEGLVYRVYLCKYHGSGFRCGYDPTDGSTSSGMYSPQCAGDPTRSKILYLNREKSVIGMGLTETGYQTVAHELMHAITANTAFGRQLSQNCGAVNRWITEGIPDAIGYDIMEELWAGKYTILTEGNPVAKRHGYRPYSISLPQDRDLQIPGYPAGAMAQGHYGTSSFWRYVADSHPSGWKNLLTRGKGSTPGLFETPLTSTTKNWRKEVQWLDAWLQKKFNHRLRDMYAMFVNNFAFRLAPFERYQGTPAEDNVEHWAGILFDQCAQVNLPSGGSQNFTLTIQQLAAGCVWVETTGPKGLVQVTFQAFGEDRALLESITIGMAGTMLVSRADIADAPSILGAGPYPHLASWRDYPQDGSRKTLYVISNLSAEPHNSVNRQVTFTASIPNNKNSARPEGSLPPARVAARPMKPSYKKNARPLTQQKSATAKMVQDQMNLDKETLSPEVSNSTALSRRPDASPCTEPFLYQPCGPHIQITLALMPGTYIVPGATNAQGGIAAQTFGGLMAMSQTSMWDSQERMQHLTALIDTIDGNQVNIMTPMFDYGETPTFDNAYINVHMSGGRKWDAIGPPNQNGWSRLRGTVTIEEYSPFVLRGRFSAPLAELVESGVPNQPPIFTPRQTVTGTFTSVAPWLEDDRFAIVMESNEQLADDIANTLGVPAGMINKMKEEGTMPGMPNYNPGAASAGGSLSTDCTCECSTKATADELCQMLCEEEFALCE